MRTTKAFVVVVAVAMICINLGYAQCVSDPADAAKSFYSKHPNFYFDDPKTVSDLVAPRLLAALKLEYACAQGEICAVEAVPWTDAQDGDAAAPITFKALDQSVTHALVDMRYTFVMSASERRPQRVQLKFERSDPSACWLLSDLVEPSGDSLLTQLEKWHKEYGHAQ